MCARTKRTTCLCAVVTCCASFVVPVAASGLDDLVRSLTNALFGGESTSSKAVAPAAVSPYRHDSYTLGQIMDGWDNTLVVGCDPSVVDYLKAKLDRLHRDPIRFTTIAPGAATQNAALLNDRYRFTVFLIDRSRAEFPEAWTHLFRRVGDPTALKPYEVLAAALDKRAKRCFNILVSAPDQRRLIDYLDWLVTQPVGYGKSPPVHEYHRLASVEPVRVVSNLERSEARDLMRQLQNDNDYSIDYLTLSQAAADLTTLDGATEVYLIATSEASVPEAIRERLPLDLAQMSASDQVAIRRAKPGGLQRVLLAYWTERHLAEAVARRFPSLDDIPETAHVAPLVDLAAYRRIAVAPVANRTRYYDDGRETATRLTNEIVTQLRHEAGFEVENKADLEALLADTALAMQGYVKRHVVDAARKMTAADALLVADLTVLSQLTEYRSSLQRSTPIPAELTTENEPEKPSPSARRYGFFGPKVYRLGSEDPAYLEDLEQWQEDHRDWKYRRARVELDWAETVTASSAAACEVQCRLISLLDGPDYGKVLWSETVAAEDSSSWTADTNNYTVRGVAAQPRGARRAAQATVPTTLQNRCTRVAARSLIEKLDLRCVMEAPRIPIASSSLREAFDLPPKGAMVAAVDRGEVWLLLGEECSAKTGDAFDVRVGTRVVRAPNGAVIHREPAMATVVVQETWPEDGTVPARARCAAQDDGRLAEIEPRQMAAPVGPK